MASPTDDFYFRPGAPGAASPRALPQPEPQQQRPDPQIIRRPAPVSAATDAADGAYYRPGGELPARAMAPPASAPTTLRQDAPGMVPNPNLGKLSFPPDGVGGSGVPASQPLPQLQPAQPAPALRQTQPAVASYVAPAAAPRFNPNSMLPPGGAPAAGSPLDRNQPTVQNAGTQAAAMAARPSVPEQTLGGRPASLDAPWYSPAYARAANNSDRSGLELENLRRQKASTDLRASGDAAYAVANYGVAASQAPTPASVGAAAPTSPVPTRNQADLRRADPAGTSKTPPDARSGFSEIRPGIYQRGRNEFSDAAGLSDEKFWSRGPVSAQNQRAADALAAHYAQGGGQPGAGQGPIVMIGRDTGGYGILDKEHQRQSWEQYEQRKIMDQLKDPSLGRSQRAALTELLKSRMNIGQSERESVRNNSTTQRGQDLNYGATLRGQDVTSRGQDLGYMSSMYGHDTPIRQKQMEIEYAKQLRGAVTDAIGATSRKGGAANIPAAVARLRMQGLGPQADELEKAITGPQAQVKAGQELDKGLTERLANHFNIKVNKPDGSYDKEGSAAASMEAAQRLLRTRPDARQWSDTDVLKNMPDARADYEVWKAWNKAAPQASGKSYQGDWIIPSFNDTLSATENEIPEQLFKQWNPQRRNMLGGGFGASRGDVTLRDGDWGSVNLGPLSAEAEAYWARRHQQANTKK